MIGGASFFAIDSGRATGAGDDNWSFADFAVLYRTDAQAGALCEAFDRSGMPYQKHSHTPLTEEPAVRTLLQELGDTEEDTPLPAALLAAAERLAQRGDALGDPTMAIALLRLTALAGA